MMRAVISFRSRLVICPTELDETRAPYHPSIRPLNEATFFFAISNCHDETTAEQEREKESVESHQRGGGGSKTPSSSLFQLRGMEKKRAPCQCHSLMMAPSMKKA